MRRLAFLTPPEEMTDAWVASETERFINDPKQNVWNKKFIKRRLLQMSENKCAYCECILDEAGNYLEVEHFLPKNLYKNQVLQWQNLLPACKRCNSSKKDFDTGTNPFVHPVNDNPKEHLRYATYRFIGITDKGKNAIKELYLNDSEKLQKPRFRIVSAILTELEDIRTDIEDGHNATRIARRFMRLCHQGHPSHAYSSIVASELLRDEHYQFIKTSIQRAELWDEDFLQLEIQLNSIGYLD